MLYPLWMHGVSRGDEIANVFALKLKGILNTHSSISRDSLLSSIQSSLTGSHLSSVDFSKDDVLVALSMLKNKNQILVASLLST